MSKSGIPRYMRPKEAARFLGVSLSTIRRGVKTGRYIQVKDGPLAFIDIWAAIEAREVTVTTRLASPKMVIDAGEF